MKHSLNISGVGFPAYTGGHCHQTLEAVPQGRFTRSVNGRLSFFGVFGTHKYKSTITGSDTSAPALGGLSCGQTVMVDCIQELVQEIHGEQTRLSRPPVAGSLYVQNPLGQMVDWQIREKTLLITPSKPPLYAHFRPRLEMLVQSFALKPEGENFNQTHWSLVLEEV